VHTSIVDTFNGLPLHVLVVHAAVILVPVAALAALTLIRPSWRMRLRWPVAAAGVGAWLLVWLARGSGSALAMSIQDQLEGTSAGAAVVKHGELANRLNQVLFALGIVLILFAVLLPRLPRAAGTVGAVVIAVLACLVIGLTAQTGEQGARAAWNPDGSQDYSVR
jgi:xanthine/uracil permease